MAYLRPTLDLRSHSDEKRHFQAIHSMLDKVAVLQTHSVLVSAVPAGHNLDIV